MTDSSENPASSIGVAQFRYYLAFRFLLTFSIQMQAIVVGWQVYNITKDPLSLGLIGLAEAISYIGTALVGGYVADRFDRRRIALVCAGMYNACSLGLLAVTLWAPADRPQTVWLFYGTVFLIGIARGFFAPAISALFAQILPRRLYLNGSAWNTNVWHTAAVAGPAAGGIVYGFFGVVTAYAVLIATSLASILVIARIPDYPFERSQERESIFSSISQGIRFVFANQIILGALGLDLIAVLFGGAVAVLPVFASDVLHTGPEGLGFLRAAPFIGSIAMGLWLARQGPMRRAGWNMIGSVAAFGACMIVFALSKNYVLSFSMLFLSGLFDTVSVVVRATTLQLLMPDHMRGRVSSVNSIFIGTSNELGAFESGVAAKLLGLIPSVVFGGTVSIVATLGVSAAAPRLRQLNIRELVDEAAKIS